MNPITPAELAAYFDHTQLRAYAQRSDFEKLCAEAREYGFAMVAINPAPVSLCKDLLAGTSVHVGAAVGFPLGQSTPKVKKYETVDAIANGADEIDYFINITQLKEKNYDFIEHEMPGVSQELCVVHGQCRQIQGQERRQGAGPHAFVEEEKARARPPVVVPWSTPPRGGAIRSSSQCEAG